MDIIKFIFCDSRDETETDIFATNFDAAHHLFRDSFGSLFFIERIEKGIFDTSNKLTGTFPVIKIYGYTEV